MNAANTAIARHGRALTMAGLVGGLTGLCAAGFHFVLDRADAARETVRAGMADRPVGGCLLLMVAGALMVSLSVWLVKRFAPEAAGSGIQEVEGTLAGLRVLRGARVIPVKFMAGLTAIASGLVLGREGPTVHMGASFGQMLGAGRRARRDQAKALIAAGAGAGLAAAFNAPLAGIIFVTEEMREEFDFGFVSMQSVILACCVAVVVNDMWLGQGPVLPVHDVGVAALHDVPLYVPLGVLLGAFGVLFNKLMLGAVRLLARLRARRLLMVGAGVGAAIGLVAWFLPSATGGGELLVERLLSQRWTVFFLLGLFALRTLTTAMSYGSGAPGGIFAPMLALGTLAGVAYGHLVSGVSATPFAPESFAVAAMGALFAATVRAPLTGIVLVVELTGAYDAVLTITITCLAATFTAESLGGRPIYRALLEESLRGAKPKPTHQAGRGDGAPPAAPEGRAG